ncbi:hypothetical protein RYX36_019740 [Vicia faba]
MNEFNVDFHHGGSFVDEKYVGGKVSNWKCDGDRWSYFEILGVAKEMKYPRALEIWYDFDGTLKVLKDDFVFLQDPKSNEQLIAKHEDDVNSQPRDDVNVQPGDDINFQEEVDINVQIEDDINIQLDRQPDVQPDDVTNAQPDSDDNALGDQLVDEILADETPPNKKRKGGRPKKNNSAGTPKKHKGRPKNKWVDETPAIYDEVSSDEDVLDFGFKEWTTSKKVCRSLSDSDYASEELESEDDTSSDYSGDSGKVKYPSFFMLKKFNDYKW